MKYHPHGSVLFCTFSVEEGLLLLSNPLCQAIIKSSLARAKALCPVKVCHFIIQATHVHMLLVVHNPDDVYGFIRNFKVETAHMLNRILGRPKRTIWCEGYDSPIVLTPIRAMAAIAYMYANPAKDNLEASIDNFPGFSSWKMFRNQEHTKTWKRLRRPQFRALHGSQHSLRGYTDEAHRLLTESEELQTFTLEPNAWMEAFKISSPPAQEEINSRILKRVRTLEERAARQRAKQGKPILGKAKMLHECINTTYRPQRSGRRMWCLSEKRRIRIQFITFFRGLMGEARAIRDKWLSGDSSAKYPPGLHPPSLPKLANVLSGW